MNSIAPHSPLPAPLTAPSIAAAFADSQEAFIAAMAAAMLRLVKAEGFAAADRLRRQGYTEQDLETWALTAWARVIAQHGTDPRMTDACDTGVLTGPRPFRLRQWVTHRETGVTGEVIAQAPHAGGLHAGLPVPGPWLVTIKTATGTLARPAAEFEPE